MTIVKQVGSLVKENNSLKKLVARLEAANAKLAGKTAKAPKAAPAKAASAKKAAPAKAAKAPKAAAPAKKSGKSDGFLL